jgi:hypothetical protein
MDSCRAVSRSNSFGRAIFLMILIMDWSVKNKKGAHLAEVISEFGRPPEGLEGLSARSSRGSDYAPDDELASRTPRSCMVSTAQAPKSRNLLSHGERETEPPKMELPRQNVLNRNVQFSRIPLS